MIEILIIKEKEAISLRVGRHMEGVQERVTRGNWIEEGEKSCDSIVIKIILKIKSPFNKKIP